MDSARPVTASHYTEAFNEEEEEEEEEDGESWHNGQSVLSAIRSVALRCSAI